jgi:hypothetical protein
VRLLPLSKHGRVAQGSRSPFIQVDATENTFFDVMLLLGKYGFHRTWLVDGAAITNVISQSTVIEVLGQNLASFPAITSATIASLGLVPKPSFAVMLTDTYWDAFKHILNSVGIHISLIQTLITMIIFAACQRRAHSELK